VRAGPAGTEPQSICALATPGKFASNIARMAARIALRSIMVVSENIGDISMLTWPTSGAFARSHVLFANLKRSASSTVLQRAVRSVP
jgi:hypothetical protein